VDADGDVAAVDQNAPAETEIAQENNPTIESNTNAPVEHENAVLQSENDSQPEEDDIMPEEDVMPRPTQPATLKETVMNVLNSGYTALADMITSGYVTIQKRFT